MWSWRILETYKQSHFTNGVSCLLRYVFYTFLYSFNLFLCVDLLTIHQNHSFKYLDVTYKLFYLKILIHKCDIQIPIISHLFVVASKPAQRVFKINMLFPTSVLCNEAGQGVLRQKVRNAVNTLNREWNFCSFSVEGTRECKELNIDVKCDHRTGRQTRQTHDDEDGGTYVVDVKVPVQGWVLTFFAFPGFWCKTVIWDVHACSGYSENDVPLLD